MSEARESVWTKRKARQFITRTFNKIESLNSWELNIVQNTYDTLNLIITKWDELTANDKTPVEIDANAAYHAKLEKMVDDLGARLTDLNQARRGSRTNSVRSNQTENGLSSSTPMTANEHSNLHNIRNMPNERHPTGSIDNAERRSGSQTMISGENLNRQDSDHQSVVELQSLSNSELVRNSCHCGYKQAKETLTGLIGEKFAGSRAEWRDF